MATRGTDAITLLTEDHKAVKKLFKSYQSLVDGNAADEDKQKLASQICRALEVHSQIEEEIFYPAVRAAIDDDQLMDEALVEHASAKDLIDQIEAMAPGDELYDAKVTVLGEYINHHVDEEQGEMFPMAKKAVDVKSLGEALERRKMELERERGAR
ncbi:MAG TPA: hemerythrin domain-containing protein [Myxococcota bacterium]|nr:hemerythrin domain-containing protein [Myxococcota bacterium]